MKLHVFYNEQQSVKNNKSLSPSAGKPALVYEMMKDHPKINIVSNFQPFTVEDISIAHEKEFVEDVLACRRVNGFNNKSEEIAKSLLWTNASFHRAAEHALKNKIVTMSPTSGFHHAEWNHSEGFCTFNGLMISAMLLKRDYEINRIGIVDFDCHYGNGTDDIIAKHNIDYIQHYTFGDFSESIKDKVWLWLKALPTYLEKNFSNVDILYYQAGADPHVDDPFGGFLTSEEMEIRDRIVFRFAKNKNIPIVWNLAGGYQSPIQKVLDLHKTTFTECLNAFQAE